MNQLDILRAALSRTASLPPTGWNMPGQYDPGMVAVRGNASLAPTGWNMPGQYDPGMASTLSALRQQVEAAGAGGGGGGDPWAGAVIGDTPGGAQSALLNLRAQNIQIEQEAARRAEQARQAALDRQLRAKLEQDSADIRRTQLADNLLSSASSRDIAAREAELRRILGIGDLEVKRAGLTLRGQPADNSILETLLGVRPQLDEAAMANEAAIEKTIAQIQANARNTARANNLLVGFDRDGMPQFSFLNPSAVQSVAPLYAAEDAAYTLPPTPSPIEGDYERVAPGRDLRAELNNLLAEQSRLNAGRKTYESDWNTALKIRNDKRDAQIPAATEQALAQVLAALRASGQPPAAGTIQSRAQQLLAARGNVVGTPATGSRRPPAPKAAKTWRLDVNGNVTRN